MEAKIPKKRSNKVQDEQATPHEGKKDNKSTVGPPSHATRVQATSHEGKKDESSASQLARREKEREERDARSFLLSGWKGYNDHLNGEYLPLEDSTKQLNGLPVFRHAPVTGAWAGKDRYRMYWSHGAWRIGDKDQMQPSQTHCMAFVESDASHPTAMPAEVVWKGMARAGDCGKGDSDFEVVEGVRLAKGTVRVPCWNFSAGNGWGPGGWGGMIRDR